MFYKNENLCDNSPASSDSTNFTFTGNINADYDKLVALVESNPNLLNKTMGVCKKTLLHKSVEHNRLGMVQYLLEKGAKHVYDINGNRPLHSACLSGSREIADLLIEHGADKEIANIEGDLPIHLAAASGNVELLKCLIDHGTDMKSKGWAGNFALHFAAENPNIDVLKELLNTGFDVSVTNNNLETALHVAAGASGFDSVGHMQLLLELGAKLDSR